MEKPIDHGVGSSVATVGLQTGKGVLAVALISAAVLAVPVALATGTFGFLAAGAGIAGGLLGGTFGAPIGAALGFFGGVSKVRGEQKSFDRQMQNQQQNVGVAISQAQQQAYMAGARDGQAQVVQKLQEIQEQQTNFAGKFAGKKGISPEDIMKQREAATASPQMGA